MATLKQKIDAEETLRELLEQEGMPPPDDIEYGHTCIRALWHEPKACVIVQIDEPPPGWKFAEDLLDNSEGLGSPTDPDTNPKNLDDSEEDYD